jgi:hypothetical protein
MNRWIRLFLLAIAALALPQLATAAAGSEKSGVTLELRGEHRVHIGESIHVRARLDGDRLDGTLKSSLSLTPADGSQLPIAVKLVQEVVFPGDVVTRDFRVDTGRFIQEPGAWVLRLGDSAPVEFEVTPRTDSLPRFHDRTAAVGLDADDWAEANPVSCTPSGHGAAWGDIDGDDDLDLYLTRTRGGGILYRNDDGYFEDATSDAGIEHRDVPEGSAVFVDVDSDGDQDLHVAGIRGGYLWINDGKGAFHDEAHRRGLDLDTAGTSSTWGDVDQDGDLDVVVVGYGICRRFEHELEDDAPRRDTLLLQRRDGTFEDRTDLLGLTPKQDGLGLGALWVDVDDDTDLDLLVVNDDLRFLEQRGGNRLWLNRLDRGKGLRLEEVGRSRGAGERRNAMGIAAFDHGRDGDLDFGVSDMGPSQLLDNDGTGRFTDIGVDVGADRGFQDGRTPSTTWGLVAVDIDNDADEDIVVPAGALGTTDDYFGSAEPQRSFGRMNLAAPNSISLLRSEHGDSYIDIGAAAGLQRYGLWRGAALADVDDDGLVDAVFTRLVGPPLYMQNETPKAGHWLALRLRGSTIRDACGSVLRIDGRAYLRDCGGTGLGSGHDPRVHVGLGSDTDEQRVDVTWPDGERERFRVSGVDRTVELVQGKGTTRVAAPDLPSDATGVDDSHDDQQLWPWLLLLVPLVAIAIVVRRRRRGPKDRDRDDS